MSAVPAFGQVSAHSPNRKAYLNQSAFALREYFESLDYKIRGLVIAKKTEAEDLRDKIGVREVAKSAMARDIERMGAPVRTDRATGQSTPVDWVKEQFGDIAEFKAKLEKTNATKIPAPQLERMDEDLVGQMGRRNWRRIPAVDYFDGDTRSSIEKKKDAMADRKLKAIAADEVLRAPVTSADAKARADAHLEALAAKGKPDLSNLFAGYAVLPYSGEYTLKNPRTTIAFPITSAATEDYQTHIPIHDVLSLLIGRDLPGWKKYIHALIDAAADDQENAISEKDKPAMLATANAELLEAQRREEQANKLCEAEGQLIFRPSDWPVEVMLEIERDDAPKPVAKLDTVSKAQPENQIKPAMAGDFEGDDEFTDDDE